MELTNLAPIVKSLKSPGNQAAAEISQLLGFLLFPFVRTYVILLVVVLRTAHHNQKLIRSTPSTTSEISYCGGSCIDSIG